MSIIDSVETDICNNLKDNDDITYKPDIKNKNKYINSNEPKRAENEMYNKNRYISSNEPIRAENEMYKINKSVHFQEPIIRADNEMYMINKNKSIRFQALINNENDILKNYTSTNSLKEPVKCAENKVYKNKVDYKNNLHQKNVNHNSKDYDTINDEKEITKFIPILQSNCDIDEVNQSEGSMQILSLKSDDCNQNNPQNNNNNINVTDHIKHLNICKNICDGVNQSGNDNNDHLPIIIDSGASSHMTPNQDWFDYIIPTKGIIEFSNKTYTYYKGKGNVGIFKDVLYVPSLHETLWSVSKLDKDGFDVNFSQGKVVITKDNKVVGEGNLINDLYYIKLPKHTERDLLSIVKQGSAPRKLKSTQLGDDPLQQLHRRWGHASENVIKNGLKHKSIMGAGTTYEDVKDLHLRLCPDCLKGRMHALPIPSSLTDHTNLEPFDLMATDEKGPFRIRSINKNYYFDLFAFKSSNWLIVKFKNKKSDLIRNIDEVLNEIKSFGYKVKIFQSDSAKAYTENSQLHQLLITENIRMQFSPPYKHEANGFIEREMQTILDKAMTILQSYADIPQYLWENAIETAVYLRNRTPQERLKWKTPYEIVFKTLPDISHLVPFYSPGLVHITTEERSTKFLPKAKECRMVGYYPYGKNVYSIYIPSENKIIQRRDCIFDEYRDISIDSKEQETNIILNQYRDIIKDNNDNNIDNLPLMIDNPNFFNEVNEVNKEIIDNDLSNIHHINNNDNNNNDDDELSNDDNYLQDDSTVDETDHESISSKSFFCFAHSINDLNEYLCKTRDISLPPVPKSDKEALQSPYKEYWIKAIWDEIHEMDSRSIFELADNQTGRSLKSKFVYDVVYDNNMQLKWKAKLVIKGYAQLKGIDYVETFAPTISKGNLRLFLQLSLIRKFTLRIGDFGRAFLEGKNKEDIYMVLPVTIFPGKIRVKVLGNLYGEKQAAFVWNTRLNEILESFGLIRIQADPCWYIYKINNEITFMLIVHVDDEIYGGTDTKFIDEFELYIQSQVKKFKVINELKKYLNIQFDFDHENNSIYIHQSSYAQNVIDSMKNTNFDISKKKRISKTPMNPGILLNDTSNKNNTDNCFNKNILLPIIGKLRFLADNTRPDILTSLGILSQGSEYITDHHINSAHQLLSYISGSLTEKIKLGGTDKNVILFAFSDASFVTTGDCKSRFGNVWFNTLDSGSFYSISQKDTSASHHSFATELKALDLCVRTTLYLRDLHDELGFIQQHPTIIYIDNHSVFEICDSLKMPNKTKHLHKIICYIREQINARKIQLKFIPSEFNIADILTKPLPYGQFHKLKTILMNGFNNVDVDTLINNL